MRLFWSIVLTGGLLFVGLDVYELRQERRAARSTTTTTTTTSSPMTAEDGTGFPPPR